MLVSLPCLCEGGKAKDDADSPGGSPRDGGWAGTIDVKERNG